ncbi:ATP-binding cassette transporter-like protein [Glossina pallidipes salivary gland hypertrophy virus]|uniref:ATP-binding cassette transporter-like protein n=1 Tax=Glossina hytrovirus (isolate Glossina pallidipes/Ethiopia/Seibersdorf/-) TaxID=379529 RepID=A0A0Y0JHX7_GHVS|nr:ATP-binding cassette transporter-like protein [Glossina pallidipes salivary gland hypertrophy virus]
MFEFCKDQFGNDIINDRGPLFAKTYDYNQHALKPISFQFSEKIPEKYHILYEKLPRNDDEHGINILKLAINFTVTYKDLLDIIIDYKPYSIWIAKIMYEDSSKYETQRKIIPSLTSYSKNDLKTIARVNTIIYMGNINLHLIEKFFPNIEKLHVSKLNYNRQLHSQVPDESGKNFLFKKLQILTVINGSIENGLNLIIMPLITEINIYMLLEDILNNSNYVFKYNNFNFLAKLRVPESIIFSKDWFSGNRKKAFKLQTIQFYPSITGINELISFHKILEKKQKINVMSKIFSKINEYDFEKMINTNSITDVTFMPNVLSKNAIINMCNVLKKQQYCTVGIYNVERFLDEFLNKFKNIQIYNYINPLQACCIRETNQPNLYFPKNVDNTLIDNILYDGTRNNTPMKMLKMKKKYFTIALFNFNFLAEAPISKININKQYEERLLNNPDEPYDNLKYIKFEDDDETKNNYWSNLRKSFRKALHIDPIIIISNEIILHANQWPELVLATKKQAIIYNPNDFGTLYLDISANTVLSIVEKCVEIYNNGFFYKKLIIVTRGFSLAESSIDLLIMKKLNINSLELQLEEKPYHTYNSLLLS